MLSAPSTVRIPALTAPSAPPPGARVTLRAGDGRPLGSALIENWDGDAAGRSWRATIGHLERAGALATAYFSEGIRDVVVELPDGRAINAIITGTRFVSAGERLCDLVAA